MKQLRNKILALQEGIAQEERLESRLDLTETFSVLAMIGSFLLLVAACLASL